MSHSFPVAPFSVFATSLCRGLPLPELRYLLLVRVLGVARGRGFVFAVLRTVIVPSLAIAGAGEASGYFLVVGQIKRQG
jgi:hypothetical protein